MTEYLVFSGVVLDGPRTKHHGLLAVVPALTGRIATLAGEDMRRDVNWNRNITRGGDSVATEFLVSPLFEGLSIGTALYAAQLSVERVIKDADETDTVRVMNPTILAREGVPLLRQFEEQRVSITESVEEITAQS